MTFAVPPVATLVRAHNPGPMTLDGTNTWVLRAPGSDRCVVVDPGPDDPTHLDAVAAAVAGPDGHGRAAAVVVTHRHADHTAGADALAARLGVPVRAALPALCSPGATPLSDGEVLVAAGLWTVVVATPGHTSDSVSLHLPDEGVVLTGDTVLGEGSTVLMERDGGDLGDYLESLDTLEALATPGPPEPAPADGGGLAADGAGLAADERPVVGLPVVGLPGHGPVVADLAATVRAYRAHRLARLDEVRAALATSDRSPDPADASVVAAVVAHVYPDVAEGLRPAAEQSVRVQLAHLARAPRR